MKSLMLLNARKRRKTRRRRTRRNPAGSTSAFRANFPKSMGRKRRTTRRRRRVLSIRRYRLKDGRAGLAVRARKIYVSRRGRKGAIIVARNPRRRRSYRMNPFGGNILSQVKGVFSKENLTIAGGGVAAGDQAARGRGAPAVHDAGRAAATSRRARSGTPARDHDRGLSRSSEVLPATGARCRGIATSP